MTDSDPVCTSGPACCEAAPDFDPNGIAPTVLSDMVNAASDHDHDQACELQEINGGLMDQFTQGVSCANATNFAIAPSNLMAVYQGWAAQYALADRYFQSIAGGSWSNNLYFARAQYVFTDNAYAPNAEGIGCTPAYYVQSMGKTLYNVPTIGDLLLANGKSFASYGEGYTAMVQALLCPLSTPSDCTGFLGATCWFDPADFPFEYYMNFVDKPGFMKDLSDLSTDLQNGTLPNFAFVKGTSYHTEHPGHGTNISNGVQFVQSIVNEILGSQIYGSNTLILLTWDEGGGFFDHISPPAANPADNQPYGTRVPLLAMGPFARQNEVSHVTLEHSSIVKFLEWNFLGGSTGQLGGRDQNVNNLGSLLDPNATGVPIPEGP
jgi:phospholipase C